MSAPKQSMNVVIHSAFRRDLARFEAALAAFPAGSRARAEQLATAWANFRDQLREHHHSEETIFWPAIREVGADESMMAPLEAEHEAMLAALQVADAAMADLVAAPTDDHATAARNAMSGLRDCLQAHLDHEERALEPLLLANLTSAPVKRASKQMQRSQKPAAAGTFFAWLQDGAAPDDQAALAATVPAPVRFILTGLFGRTYRQRVASVWQN
jgi:hemerythrin-like domain-containing protein